MPALALEQLNDCELWALQRDLIDAALAARAPPEDVLSRIRIWARSFEIGGADDLAAIALWASVRPLVDHQAEGVELDWLSPRMQAILAEAS